MTGMMVGEISEILACSQAGGGLFGALTVLVMVSVRVKLTELLVLTTVIELEPTARLIGLDALPEETDVPFSVIVEPAAVGVTVIVEVSVLNA
jgi:hypothetical protein